MAALYAYPRLYVKFFRPSFELQSKTREGARVRKKYEKPATPYEQLMASDQIKDQTKNLLKEQFFKLDPIHLVKEIWILREPVSPPLR